MEDIVLMLRERAARKWTDEADRSASLFGQAADEIERLRGLVRCACGDEFAPDGPGLCVNCRASEFTAGIERLRRVLIEIQNEATTSLAHTIYLMTMRGLDESGRVREIE